MLLPRWQDFLTTGLLLTGVGGVAEGQQPTNSPPALPPGARPVVLFPGPPVTYAPARTAYPLFPKAAARGSILHQSNGFETPLGLTLDLHFQTHITNAAAARMVLYDYDFVSDSDQLNVRGKDRVRQLGGLIDRSSFPIIVERMPYTPALAERRRRAVLTELASVLGMVPADRVVVGPPLAAPLQGVESERIYQNLLLLSESYGTMPGTGVRGGSGGATGGGASGNAGSGSSSTSGR